jgi:hypothetical protein
MNTSPQAQDSVEYRAHDGRDRDEMSSARRDVKKDAVAQLYAKYIHAVLSHPEIERRRRKR